MIDSVSCLTVQTHSTPEVSPLILTLGPEGEGIILNGNHRRAAIMQLEEPLRAQMKMQPAIVLHRDTPEDVIRRIIACRSGTVVHAPTSPYNHAHLTHNHTQR